MRISQRLRLEQTPPDDDNKNDDDNMKNPVGRPRIFKKGEERVKLFTYIDKTSHTRLKLLAKRSGISMSYILREMIERYSEQVTLQLMTEKITFGLE